MPNFAPAHDRFMFVDVAGRRAKQLLRGAYPRVESTLPRSPAARIAQEEVFRGLIPFQVPVREAGGDAARRPGEYAAGHEGIRLTGSDATLSPAPIAARGGASAVITNPDAVMTLHAASLATTMSSFFSGLAGQSAGFLQWRVWTHEMHESTQPETGEDQELASLRAALSVLRSAWVADTENGASLVMTVTVREEANADLAIDASEPVLAAYPGSLILTMAGKLVKPVSWIATLSHRGGLSRSVVARSIRDRLRQRALRRGNIEILPELREVTSRDLGKASALVIFVHGLLSTDIGTFDPLIDRVRLLKPDTLRIGFAHNTLASIEVNAQELAKWLISALGFDHEHGTVKNELPVVFCCHSRGGLVARAAASQLLEVNKTWRKLLRGAVTFGTPHRGAALAEAPEQMAAVVAVISVLHGCGTVMSVADVLAYIRNGGTFEGIRDLQPAEGAKDSTVNFLKILQGRELVVGEVPRLAFGGTAASNSVVSRIVGRALGSGEHDHVVERSSSTPDALAGVGTDCNHFAYFATAPGNKHNLDRAARQIVAWLQ